MWHLTQTHTVFQRRHLHGCYPLELLEYILSHESTFAQSSSLPLRFLPCATYDHQACHLQMLERTAMPILALVASSDETAQSHPSSLEILYRLLSECYLDTPAVLQYAVHHWPAE